MVTTLESPIGSHFPRAILPNRKVPGWNGNNTVDYGPGRRNMTELKINAQRVGIHSPLDQAGRKQALQFRSKDQPPILPRKVKWLDTQTIPRQEELVRSCIPDREGKHPAHSLHTGIAIFLIEVEYYLRVRFGLKAISFGHQILTQLGCVVSL